MGLGEEKRGIRILVVDDDKSLADLLAEFLEKLGYEVTAVYNPHEALTLFQQNKFPLVITDLMMPEMDGLALLREIKRIEKRSIVLVVTGYGTIESAVKAIKSGAYDFIPKPFKFEEMKIVLDRCLERYGLAKQLGFFRGLVLALLVAVPVWLILGIIVGLIWK